jgi:hypothetical protein
VLGAPGCFAAGWFELTRALGGRQIAWVYAFEWPLYGVAGTYMWWRMFRTREPVKRERPVRSAAHDIAADDPGLTAWQDYVARLHAIDPPGGPPANS